MSGASYGLVLRGNTVKVLTHSKILLLVYL